MEQMNAFYRVFFQYGADGKKSISRIDLNIFKSRDEYLELPRLLRARRPDIAITTDLIVGFPGETGRAVLRILCLRGQRGPYLWFRRTVVCVDLSRRLFGGDAL